MRNPKMRYWRVKRRLRDNCVMKWVLLSICLWLSGFSLNLWGQTDPQAFLNENLISLSLFILLIPYPIWYIRSALVARRNNIATTPSHTCLILSVIFISLIAVMTDLITLNIILHLSDVTSDEPMIRFNQIIIIIGILAIFNLICVIAATASLRTTQEKLHIPPINPILCFVGFLYLPIGMFFLKTPLSRIANPIRQPIISKHPEK